MHLADAAATRRCPSDFQLASAHSFSGKERGLPLETAGQLHAVQCAAEVTAALGSATGKIIPPELTLKHAYDVQRDEWRIWAATVPATPTCTAHGKTNAETMVILGHGEERSGAPYGV